MTRRGRRHHVRQGGKAWAVPHPAGWGGRETGCARLRLPVMIVEKRQLNGFTILAVEGVIKLGESAQFFAQTLERALADDRGHVIIDFSRINFIDSTGIGELVGYLGRFRNASRELILVNPSERIRKLLQVARLADLFTIYDSVDAAMAAER